MFVFILNFNFRYFFNFKVHGSSLQSVFEEYLVPVTTFAQLENNLCCYPSSPASPPFFKISLLFFFSFLSYHTIYWIHILFTRLSHILISPGHLNYELCTTYAALWILAFTFCQQVQLDLNSIKSILASASKLEGSSIMKCKVGGSLWKVPVVLLRSDTQHINTNIWVSYSISRIRVSLSFGRTSNEWLYLALL